MAFITKKECNDLGISITSNNDYATYNEIVTGQGTVSDYNSTEINDFIESDRISYTPPKNKFEIWGADATISLEEILSITSEGFVGFGTTRFLYLNNEYVERSQVYKTEYSYDPSNEGKTVTITPKTTGHKIYTTFSLNYWWDSDKNRQVADWKWSDPITSFTGKLEKGKVFYVGY